MPTVYLKTVISIFNGLVKCLTVFTLLNFSLHNTCFASDPADSTLKSSRRRINIIVSNKMTKPDLALISFQMQAKWQRIFHKKEMFVIIAGSVNDLTDKIVKIMDRENALIGNLWFDSHGHMGRRISLFEIGKDEINYRTIRENHIREAIAKIGSYCDSNTNIGLGSCYSAASFTLPPVDKFPEQRMNGDSLMIRVSELMNNATVFGTEGWVMTRPGIFNNSYALAGKPGKNRFKDPVFLPVWKNLGQWKSYSASKGYFKRVETISMDKTGNINSNYMSYLAFEKNRKKQMKSISRLKNGNFDTRYFYKYEFPPNTSNHLAKIPEPQNSSN
jgi:hypothetical protein